MSEREFLDKSLRVIVVFVILLVVLYAVNREGFYAIWNMIVGFVSFLSNNVQLIALLLLVLAIAYLLRSIE